MIRYIGYVESIDWEDNTCRVRIPNIDGLGKSSYNTPYLRALLPNRPEVESLNIADIPYHLQGLRVHDVVYLLDSEHANDRLSVIGFYGGVSEEA